MGMEPTTINIVSAVGSRKVSVGGGVNARRAINEQPPTGSPVGDTVELSPKRITRSRADVPSPQQFARMCEIRAAIAGGKFETLERMRETAKRLLKVLGWSEQHRVSRGDPTEEDRSCAG
jgi:hypothetical protein